jgi:hypothetical protein
MIFIATGGNFNLTVFSMASRSPGSKNNLIYIKFRRFNNCYCLHQENPGKISVYKKLHKNIIKSMSYNA